MQSSQRPSGVLVHLLPATFADRLDMPNRLAGDSMPLTESNPNHKGAKSRSVTTSTPTLHPVS